MSPAHDDFDAEGRDRAMAGSPAGGLDLEQIAKRLSVSRRDGDARGLYLADLALADLADCLAEIRALQDECAALRTALRRAVERFGGSDYPKHTPNWPCPVCDEINAWRMLVGAPERDLK